MNASEDRPTALVREMYMYKWTDPTVITTSEVHYLYPPPTRRLELRIKTAVIEIFSSVDFCLSMGTLPT